MSARTEPSRSSGPLERIRKCDISETYQTYIIAATALASSLSTKPAFKPSSVFYAASSPSTLLLPSLLPHLFLILFKLHQHASIPQCTQPNSLPLLLPSCHQPSMPLQTLSTNASLQLPLPAPPMLPLGYPLGTPWAPLGLAPVILC